MRLHREEVEQAKDRLRELLQKLLRNSEQELSTDEKQELREILSVLTSIPLHSVGDTTVIAGARLALRLRKVEGKLVEIYYLIVWANGQVTLMDPATNLIDLDMSV
ncbi:hypothetical protein GF342_02305 [Candidatus Woesearchaeota archaeon]|nr:hypothetical protein [Candidatus Woesearchaeota archaeon]